MSEFTKIDRLNEDHDKTLPQGLLDMTVGELLDKLPSVDDPDVQHAYDWMESMLTNLQDKIIDDSYPAEEGTSDVEKSVETEDDGENSEDEAKNKEEFPSFGDLESKKNQEDRASGKGTENIDGFNF